MTLPTLTKTWIISPNNRIPFVSLAATVAANLFGIKEFLKTNGYVVRSSCNGSGGVPASISDGVDRWVTDADASTRGASTTAPQSWMILRDGNGIDILLTFQGSNDYNFKVAFSPGQNWALAGTVTHQPTATDQQVAVPATRDMIGSTASLDRLWTGWVTSDATMCRFGMVRAGAWVGCTWGVEEFTPTVTAPATVPVPTWGFSMPVAQVNIPVGGGVGVARPSVSAVPFNCVVHYGVLVFDDLLTTHSTYKPELQGGAEYLMLPLALASETTGARGRLGDVIDMWTGRTNGDMGMTYGLRQFMSMPGYGVVNNGGAWPWDSTVELVLF